MSPTRVKNFDFHNNTSKNIFSHPYICYTASEKLEGEEQFHSKNYFFEMRLNSAPQKLNFLIEKAASKGRILDCSYKRPCTFPLNYAQ